MASDDEIILELPDKDTAETLDYEIDLADMIPAPYILDDVAVEITAAGNYESPLELMVIAGKTEAVVSSCGGTGDRVTAVHFWLTGGTSDVRYLGKVTASDNASFTPDRIFVRRFYVKVIYL